MKTQTNLFLKIISLSIPVILIPGGLVYLELRANRLKKEFYKMKITSTVVKKSDWQKRSIDFYLDNGVELNLLAPADKKMRVGDSIFKSNDTFLYHVYRKAENGKYVLLFTYDYLEKY